MSFGFHIDASNSRIVLFLREDAVEEARALKERYGELLELRIGEVELLPKLPATIDPAPLAPAATATNPLVASAEPESADVGVRPVWVLVATWPLIAFVLIVTVRKRS